MKIVIGGGSGLIGQELTHQLEQRGHSVLWISRYPRYWMSLYSHRTCCSWNVIEKNGLPKDTDVVVNLAAGSAMSYLWTQDNAAWNMIAQSRFQTTHIVQQAIIRAKRPPFIFLNASAFSYYPSTPALYFESHPPGTAPCSRTCIQWEAATSLPYPLAARVRTLRLRFAFVLVKKKHFLYRLTTLLKYAPFLRLGPEKKVPFPWVQLEDAVAAILHCIDRKLIGPVNIATPTQSTIEDIAALLRRDQYTLCPPVEMPYWALRLFFGQRAYYFQHNRWIYPKLLLESHFTFRYNTLEKCLKI